MKTAKELKDLITASRFTRTMELKTKEEEKLCIAACYEAQRWAREVSKSNIKNNN